MEELDLYVYGPPMRALPLTIVFPLVRYLPSYPYQDNSVLHVYAGLIALYIAQPASVISEETRYGPFLSGLLVYLVGRLMACARCIIQVRVGMQVSSAMPEHI